MLVDRNLSYTRVGEVIFPSEAARNAGCGYYTEVHQSEHDEVQDSEFFPAIVIDPMRGTILTPSGKLKNLSLRSLVSSERSKHGRVHY